MSDAFDKRIKKHIIGKPHRFLAVVPLGFEQTLINELKSIGVETFNANNPVDQPHIVGDGKVEFTAKITEAWKAVAFSRIANRVLMHIADFKAENFREFEKKAAEIPWELYLPDDKCVGRASRPCLHEHDRVQHLGLERSDNPKTSNVIPNCARDPVKFTNALNIHVTCKHSRLYHSDAIAERLYKIIEGVSLPLAPADSASATPSAGAPRNAPMQNLYVTLIDDRCTIWQDLAGEELYKRGFERFVNDAPLKETIAVAMIFEAIEILRLRATHSTQDDTEHPRNITLIDPMAGSGTFSLEAASIANKIIPGVCRDFALKHHPAFKEASWNFITRSGTPNDTRSNTPSHVTLSEAKAPIKSCNATRLPIIAKILTSDISERSIEIINHNVDCCPLASIEPKPITPQIRDFFSYTAKEIADASDKASPIIVLNPPYGKRLDFDAPKLYTKIGRKLTQLGNDLKQFHKELTVAILAPKDDTHVGSKYTCTSNLLRECSALSPKRNSTAKQIVTSHGGFSLNVFIAKV